MDDLRPEPAERATKVRALRLVDPGRRELRVLSRRLRVGEVLIRQLQDPSLAPGFVQLGEQLLLRWNLPRAEPEEPLRWNRLDVILGASYLITIEPRTVDALDRAWDGFPRLDAPLPRERLLSALVGALTAAFGEALDEVRRELDALRELGMLSGARGAGPAEMARDQLRELTQSARQQMEVLGRLSKEDHPSLGGSSVSELRVRHDQLAKLLTDAEGLREKIDSLEAEDREAQLGAESPEIIEVATAMGQRRLHRVTLAHGITALIGGMAVSFGALAMGWTGGPWMGAWGYERAQLLSAVAFPIGFLILIVGKGELFTENFFVPVTGVVSGRGRVADLLLLWASTLFFNFVGGIIFAFLASRPEVITDGSRAFLIELARTKIALSFGAAFVKAIFAGWLMTLMTWMLLAARGSGARIVIVWSVGFLLVAGHFNHVVISASEIFLAMGLGASISVGEWAGRSFVPALLGNLVGGLIFVTLLGYVQARSLRQGEERIRREARK